MGNAKENFKQALYAVIETYGTEILNDSRRINALLMDYAPGQTRERKLIVSALEEGIGGDLLKARDRDSSELKLCVNRCIRCLVDATWVTEEAAQFAVDSISYALGIRITELPQKKINASAPKQDHSLELIKGTMEEHSHATEQSLVGDNLSAWISATDSVVFVDDEISTGKTLTNMIEQLKYKYPQLKSKKIVAASLLNRVSEEDERKLITAGIVCEYLLKLPQTDYSSAVKDIAICEAPVAVPAKIETNYQALFCKNFDNPRKGVQIGRYKHGCEEMAETFLAQFVHKIKNGSSILVLGTEECMYPALRLGAVLEDMGQNYHVRCHATTRSPIGVCTDENYPITSGYKLNSFYDINRPTYIYNLCEYDTVVVVTDTFVKEFTALESLVGALPNKKAVQLFYIQGGKNVWCMKQ